VYGNQRRGEFSKNRTTGHGLAFHHTYQQWNSNRYRLSITAPDLHQPEGLCIMMTSMRQKGQVLVLTALMLPLILVPMLFALVDEAYSIIGYSDASQAAMMAARSGASQVNIQALDYSNVFELDPAMAQSACNANLQANLRTIPGGQTQLTGNGCSATYNSTTATVNIKIRVPFPSPINGNVHLSYTAYMQCGIQTPLAGECPVP
jgi:Flp pilus assembly protein TadG